MPLADDAINEAERVVVNATPESVDFEHWEKRDPADSPSRAAFRGRAIGDTIGAGGGPAAGFRGRFG